MSELRAVPEKLDNFLILRLRGEFEGMAVIESKEELLGHIKKVAAQEIVMDFGEIQYIDSAGIGVLLEMAKKAASLGIRFGLLNANDSVKKVITITKVDKILKCYDAL